MPALGTTINETVVGKKFVDGVSNYIYTGINGKDRYKFELVARQLN